MSWSATRATIAAFYTLDDIQRASDSLGETKHATPVLKLVSESRSKGYDAVCMPLTTDKWRERWAQMCIQSSEWEGDEQGSAAAERRAEEWRARPAFLKDEVTITRLG
jgi:type II protein arginine methyltransferase